jgi:tRNA(fMet)-specific endonuclease VapC
MSLWVFDTDSLTLWLRGHQGIAARVSRTTPSQLATTIITVEELLRGWYTQVRRAHDDDQLARAYQALQETVEFTCHIQILAFHRAAGDGAGHGGHPAP